MALKQLNINQLAQLTGMFSVPVSCANALIIGHISATAASNIPNETAPEESGVDSLFLKWLNTERPFSLVLNKGLVQLGGRCVFRHFIIKLANIYPDI